MDLVCNIIIPKFIIKSFLSCNLHPNHYPATIHWSRYEHCRYESPKATWVHFQFMRNHNQNQRVKQKSLQNNPTGHVFQKSDISITNYVLLTFSSTHNSLKNAQIYAMSNRKLTSYLTACFKISSNVTNES